MSKFLFKLEHKTPTSTDLCMEDGEGLCCVQRDENSHQELLMFSFQRQCEAIDDAGGEEKYHVI